MLPMFLNAVLINERYQKLLIERARTAGATREALTKQVLEKLQIPLPPLALQQEFADFVALVDKLKSG